MRKAEKKRRPELVKSSDSKGAKGQRSKGVKQQLGKAVNERRSTGRKKEWLKGTKGKGKK
jgi:hypothetical protein